MLKTHKRKLARYKVSKDLLSKAEQSREKGKRNSTNLLTYRRWELRDQQVVFVPVIFIPSQTKLGSSAPRSPSNFPVTVI
jgi:hypothetical protein